MSAHAKDRRSAPSAGLVRDRAADDRRPLSDAPGEEVARGISAALLARPAGELLAEVPWEGAAPDPDTTDAASFLAGL